MVAYCSKGYAQDVLINQNGGIPDGSAALEVQSNSKGFLPPRLTTVQANAISSPADGLLIFNLDSACYCYFNGSSWVTLVNSGDTLSTISDNDGDTRIETEPGVDGDSIALYTQGNQVMHLSDIGTVGFGRSAPTNADNRLEIYRPTSNTELQLTTGGNNDVRVNFTSLFQEYSIGQFDNPKTFRIFDGTKNASRFTIDTSGNVGIGTTSPEEFVHIKKDYSNLLFEGLSPHAVMSHGSLILDIDENSNSTTDKLIVRTDSTTELMVVQEDGNVGIGTTSPLSKLHLQGQDNASNTTAITIRSTATTKASSIRFDKASNGETVIGPNHNLGTVGASGYDGSAYQSSSSIIFSADGTIGTNDVPGRIEFATRPSGGTATVERMRIDNAGNVGIGTTAPATDLHVAPGASGQTFSNISGLAIENDGTSNSFYVFQTATSGGGKSFSITNAGNVGIGTDAPAAPVHIVGAYPANANTGQLHIAGPTAADNMLIGRTATYGFVQTQSAEPLVLNPISNSVGIGTTSPTAKLQIDGTDDLSLTNDGLVLIGRKNASNIVIDGNEIMARNNGTKSRLFLQNSGGDFSVGNTKFYLTDAGSLGLGSSAPTNELHIVGSDTRTDGRFGVFIDIQNKAGFVSSTGNITSGIRFKNVTGNFENAYTHAGILFQTTAADGYGNLVLANKNTGTGFPVDVADGDLVITPAGDIGIGTAAPGYKLHVSENNSAGHVATIENTNTGTNADGLRIVLGQASPGTSNNYLTFYRSGGTIAGQIEGNGNAVSYNTTSDRRLKTNIKNFNSGLNLLSDIQPRSYERKTTLGKVEIGFIAQELKQVFPQMVSGDSTLDVQTAPMMVSYSDLTPVLAAAIKELHELVKNQQFKIERLESENSVLKSELIEIEDLKTNQKELQEQLKLIHQRINTGVTKQ